jgi:RNA polymerase sigma-70 factor (ECF subfamily)
MSMSASPALSNGLAAFADCDLVTRAVDGREDGFEELVRRYQRPIAAYVYRMVGDYESALDLTQEVFIKVYNSLRRYRSEFKFSTWIYKIAHNAAVDYLRRHRMTRGTTPGLTGEADGEQYDLPIESRKLSPEQESERAERCAEIGNVVRALPAAYRELVLLRHSYDMSYDEIAHITNLPLGTVKNRLFRAREVMRQEFVQRGITGV